MLVLFETAAGYAVFKLLDEKKLKKVDNIWNEFSTPEKAQDLVKLISFKRFKDTSDALEATTAITDGKCGKTLRKLLKSTMEANSETEQLAVGDAKLGNMIKEKFALKCVANESTAELMRAIRTHLACLLGDANSSDLVSMNLGLAHSLGRYRVKFNPEKIDTMIVQAISLLDDLDKELNNYVMRCREWYGWHFPELGKIVTDPQAFAKVVKKIGMRQNAATADLSDILTEELEKRVKDEAEISMGTDISELDNMNIQELCEQILQISAYRTQLFDYLKNRMTALAPNLTSLLGELVGARLISHAGSLMSLAKYPASTVQILGAEKALFRALKTKKDTPKYGLIYHAQLIGQSGPKFKGKMARKLAAKASLATRIDALSDADTVSTLGIDSRAYLEAQIKIEQERGNRRISGTGKAQVKHESYRFKSEIVTYDNKADSTIPHVGSKKRPLGDDDASSKSAKKVKLETEEHVEEMEETGEKKKKKKKKRNTSESDGGGGAVVASPKKRKAKSVADDDDE